MSQTQRENLKILIGGIVSACLILFTFYLNASREDEKELIRKVDYIYINSISRDIRDSLQTVQLGTLEVRMAAHERQTNTAIQHIMQSMMMAKDQMVDVEEKFPDKKFESN